MIAVGVDVGSFAEYLTERIRKELPERIQSRVQDHLPSVVKTMANITAEEIKSRLYGSQSLAYRTGELERAITPYYTNGPVAAFGVHIGTDYATTQMRMPLFVLAGKYSGDIMTIRPKFHRALLVPVGDTPDERWEHMVELKEREDDDDLAGGWQAQYYGDRDEFFSKKDVLYKKEDKDDTPEPYAVYKTQTTVFKRVDLIPIFEQMKERAYNLVTDFIKKAKRKW